MPKKKTSQQPRTRFAPSPTGPLHMGGVRTALFNYLFAKHSGGTYVLRIEDTDKERSKPEWEHNILENFEWLGLSWDEFYRQSERVETHKKYLLSLFEQEKTYYCFCTPEELDAQKRAQLAAGQAPRYAGTCRAISAKQADQFQKEGRGAVIRFRIDEQPVAFHDLIRGKIEFNAGLIGDIVIAKDLDTPLYNFSVVIDDHEMQISHVIRGEEHIPNTPRQILIQQALGFPTPSYAHLPLILGPDRTKLSKRHGDNSMTNFREEGFLPEAILNFLALLGWNPGDDREIFTLEQLIQEFSLERAQQSPAVFNIERLEWINGWYIRHTPPEKLVELCIPMLIQAGLLERKNDALVAVPTKYPISKETLQAIITLYQERLKRLCDISELIDFFFVETPEYEKELLQWKDASNQKTRDALDRVEEILDQIPEEHWSKETLSETLMPEAEKETNRGFVLWPLRVALTGKKASAGPFEAAEVLGKERSLSRIQQAKEKLS